MKQRPLTTPNHINYEEYSNSNNVSKYQASSVSFRYKELVKDKPMQLSPLTLNISSIIAEYTLHNGVTFATPRIGSRKVAPPL